MIFELDLATGNLCHSEPRLTFSLKDQAYFLTLHTVFYQHALSEGDDNYKKPPIQLIFHVNRHHPYNRLIDKTLVYLLNENALPSQFNLGVAGLI